MPLMSVSTPILTAFSPACAAPAARAAVSRTAPITRASIVPSRSSSCVLPAAGRSCGLCRGSSRVGGSHLLGEQPRIHEGQRIGDPVRRELHLVEDIAPHVDAACDLDE